MGKKRDVKTSIVVNGENAIGNITASGNARVSVSQKKVTQPPASPELTRLFAEIYQELKNRPVTPGAGKTIIRQQVKLIEKEAAKGEKADQKNLGNLFEFLEQIAPDIVDVFIASLGGPVSGFSVVLKKIAERAKSKPVSGKESNDSQPPQGS